jgi:hypothetical protein
MAACTPSIHVFLGRPLFRLSSGILLMWLYHCSLFFSMMSMMSGFPFTYEMKRRLREIAINIHTLSINNESDFSIKNIKLCDYKVSAMKCVKFLDSVLNKKYRKSTPLEKVTLIRLDFNLDLIKDSFNYGIMVPRLMGIICKWSRLQYTRAYAHSPVR